MPTQLLLLLITVYLYW